MLPAGRFVKETLLSRLQVTTNNPHLSPVHRIDRGTAGLVLFCKQVKHRGLYQNLFKKRQVQKEYLAVCHVETQAKKLDEQETQIWKHQIVKANTIKASAPWFTMGVNPQSQLSNAETEMRYLGANASGHVTLRVRPITGRKHQLRVQLAHMGYPIVNDPFYPITQDEGPDCFDQPLQLLAAQLGFVDPITQCELSFKSTRQLKYAAKI